MITQRTFSNEDLTAYLDGEADVGLSQAIDEAKAASPDVRARLEVLRIDAATVRAAFDAVLPASIIGAPSRQVAQMPWRALAATALISLAVGWGASHLVVRSQTETWQHYAATYHAMYVSDTLAHVRPTVQTTADELQRVSAALGLAIQHEALARSDQLEFKRAQMLGFEGQPVAQLAFVTKSGAPVALCITRTNGVWTETVSTRQMLGMSAATWSKGPYQYLLIGGTDAGLIAKSAQAFAEAL
jgi:anti-sigma factor RsiW